MCADAMQQPAANQLYKLYNPKTRVRKRTNQNISNHLVIHRFTRLGEFPFSRGTGNLNHAAPRSDWSIRSHDRCFWNFRRLSTRLAIPRDVSYIIPKLFRFLLKSCNHTRDNTVSLAGQKLGLFAHTK